MTLSQQVEVRPCATCGDGFRPRRVQLKAGQGRFCSQRCNTAIRDANKNQKTCSYFARHAMCGRVPSTQIFMRKK